MSEGNPDENAGIHDENAPEEVIKVKKVPKKEPIEEPIVELEPLMEGLFNFIDTLC